jgi:hypothetical protein
MPELLRSEGTPPRPRRGGYAGKFHELGDRSASFPTMRSPMRGSQCLGPSMTTTSVGSGS